MGLNERTGRDVGKSERGCGRRAWHLQKKQVLQGPFTSVLQSKVQDFAVCQLVCVFCGAAALWTCPTWNNSELRKPAAIH